MFFFFFFREIKNYLILFHYFFRYQKCIEKANEEMSIKLQQQTTVEAILDVLCDGMNKVRKKE